MRREKDEAVRAERQSILFALLAAVSSCAMVYGRPLPTVSESGLKVRRIAERTEKSISHGGTENTEVLLFDRSRM